MSDTTKNTEKELEHEKAKQAASDQKTTTEKLQALTESKNSNELHRSEIEALVEKAHLLNNPVLRQALYLESYRREHSKKELHGLGNKIRTLIKELSQEADPEKVHKILLEQVLKQNTLDAQLIKALNAFLKDKPKSIPVSTHKLLFPVTTKKEGSSEEVTTEWGSIEGGRKFLERHFMDVVDNKPLGDYVYDAEAYNTDVVTVLGNTAGAKGNPRETDLKTGLLTMLAELNKLTRESVLKPRPPQRDINFDLSSLADLRALPDFDPKQVTAGDHNFSDCTFHYSDERTKLALLVPHASYEYGGGHIPEARQPQGKLLGSRDCSSGISEFVNCPKPVSTLTQLYYYNLKTQGAALTSEHKEASEKAKQWELEKSQECQPSEVQVMMEHFEVVTDPSKAKPGDIYFHRGYNLTVDPTMTGIGTAGGHTAIIAEEVRNNGEVWTIGYNRERSIDANPHKMSFFEGNGLQRFSVQPMDRQTFKERFKADDPYRKPMILRAKPK